MNIYLYYNYLQWMRRIHQALMLYAFNYIFYKTGNLKLEKDKIKKLSINKLDDILNQRNEILKVYLDFHPSVSEDDAVKDVKDAIDNYRIQASLPKIETFDCEDLSSSIIDLVDSLNNKSIS